MTPSLPKLHLAPATLRAPVLHDFTSLLAASASRFGHVDGDLLALALALQAANLLLRATAWRNVLVAAYPEERVPLLGVGASYVAGTALNSLAPARAGEALKVALARTQVRSSSVVTIAAAGSVVLVLDAIVGAGFLAAAWQSHALPHGPHLSVLAHVRAHPAAAAIAAVVVAAGVAFAAHRLGCHARRLARKLVQGCTILRTPGLYARRVALPQLGAWACRVGVAFSLLLAFGLHATIPLALVVVVAGSASNLAPATPGGAGTQQLLLVYALGGAASASAALSFSIGMQVGLTAVNAFVGLAAVMLLARTLHPLRAVRAGLSARG
jgi:glycosyltransferase 2 family protein